MGSRPLCERFPRLFSISTQKDGVLVEFWRERERWRRGEWGWRRRLFVWEEALFNELWDSVPVLTLSEEEDDWKWVFGDDGILQ
jgi:hypothetical protein